MMIRIGPTTIFNPRTGRAVGLEPRRAATETIPQLIERVKGAIAGVPWPNFRRDMPLPDGRAPKPDAGTPAQLKCRPEYKRRYDEQIGKRAANAGWNDANNDAENWRKGNG